MKRFKNMLKCFSKTEVQEDERFSLAPMREREELLSEQSELSNSGEGYISCAEHTVTVFSPFTSHFSQLCLPSPVRHPLPREGNKVSCAKHTEKNLFTYLPILLFSFKKAAFTLAEVLITLGIIGIVAALTLPTLVQNHKKQTYVNQLKKVVNTLENAAQMAVAQEGVSSFKDTTLFNAMNDIYFCTYAEESVFCKQDVVKHYFKLLDLNYEISTSKYKSFQNPSTLISVMGVGAANMHLPNGAILYFQGGGDSVVFDIDVNGATAPNQEGYDFYRLQLSQTGTIKDNYCNTEIESEYLEKGCFYKKIVSDGWKMDY